MNGYSDLGFWCYYGLLVGDKNVYINWSKPGTTAGQVDWLSDQLVRLSLTQHPTMVPKHLVPQQLTGCW